MNKILIIFFLWRVYLFFIAYISPKFISEFGNKFPYAGILQDTKLPHFIWSFANFDGVHYLGIAREFYSRQYTQAFFPLYPTLINLISNTDYKFLLIAGLLVSNVSFIIGMFVFYKLIKSKFNEKTAFWSLLFIVSFPTSFFFGSLYTEGIFFLLTITAFYWADKSKALNSSIFGALASATRLVGIILLPALLFEAKIKNKLFLLLIPAGLIAYMIYLQQEFNNPLYFLTAQSAFEQGRSTSQIVLLPQVFYRYLKILMTTEGMVLTTALFEFIATIFAFAILIWGYKKIPLSWAVFSFLVILVPTLTGTLTSMPRYILAAFPIFIILAQINSNKIKMLTLIIFLATLTLSTLYFTQGYWVA